MVLNDGTSILKLFDVKYLNTEALGGTEIVSKLSKTVSNIAQKRLEVLHLQIRIRLQLATENWKIMHKPENAVFL